MFAIADARNVVEGFEPEHALDQLAKLLRTVARASERYGTVVVIEPLNRIECNTVNSVTDGLALGRLVDRRSICVLADSYHVGVETGLETSTRWLESIGYQGDVSVEAYCPLPDAETTERIRRCAAVLTKLRSGN